MSANAERLIREARATLSADAFDLLAELLAERSAHRATLAALDRILSIAWHSEFETCAPPLPNIDRWRIVAECREQFAANRPEPRTRLISDSSALAQARGSRGAR